MPPSEPIAAEMTPAELSEARAYHRRQLSCALADRALDLAYLAVAAWWLAGPLDRWLQGFSWLSRGMGLRLVVFLVILGLGQTLLGFPLACYRGFVLEHRYQLSRLSLRGWGWRYFKELALGLALMAVLLWGLYELIWLTGGWWWLAAAGAFFVVSVLLGQLAPVLVLPLFYTIQRLDMPEVLSRIAQLAEGTGLSIEGVYRIALSEETKKANAMLAGLGRTRRVLLGDTLLAGFTPAEIAVIFAHEIGHHVHRHIVRSIVAGAAFSLAGFAVCDRLVMHLAGYATGPAGYAGVAVSSLPGLLLVLMLLNLMLEPLQNAISRHYERQSDRYALTRTGDRAAYVSAFRKLARMNKSDPSPP